MSAAPAADSPTVKGDPAVGVNTPVTELIWNTQMAGADSLPTNKKRPNGSEATSSAVPTPPGNVNGVPVIAVSAPVWRSMLYPATVAEPVGTYRNCLFTIIM